MIFFTRKAIPIIPSLVLTSSDCNVPLPPAGSINRSVALTSRTFLSSLNNSMSQLSYSKIALVSFSTFFRIEPRSSVEGQLTANLVDQFQFVDILLNIFKQLNLVDRIGHLSRDRAERELIMTVKRVILFTFHIQNGDNSILNNNRRAEFRTDGILIRETNIGRRQPDIVLHKVFLVGNGQADQSGIQAVVHSPAEYGSIFPR